MKDPMDIAQDVIRKANRDQRCIALLRVDNGAKKMRASELHPKHMKSLIGVYSGTATEQMIAEDVIDVFNKNLCV